MTKQHKYSWNNRQLADCFLNKSLEIINTMKLTQSCKMFSVFVHLRRRLLIMYSEFCLLYIYTWPQLIAEVDFTD